MQYAEKAETAFNLRFNNNRKDTKKPSSILACKHFQEQGHNFNKHAKFIIIDKLVNLHGSKEALRKIGKRKFLDSEAKNTSSIWT